VETTAINTEFKLDSGHETALAEPFRPNEEMLLIRIGEIRAAIPSALVPSIGILAYRRGGVRGQEIGMNTSSQEMSWRALWATRM
jgi:hypothetical protein